jgi:predicted phosphodiesterase
VERIAVISDLHGNVPATEAVLADIGRRGIIRIFCLGDLVGKGPDSDRTVDLARAHCELTVRGNWDDFICRTGELPVVHWHRAVLGEERIAYLDTLPLWIELWMSGRLIRLFHASPRSFNERVQPWDTPEQRQSLMEAPTGSIFQEQSDVVGYGDIHQSYLEQLPGGRTLFNAGSVGNPLDQTQSSYVILEGEYGSREPAPFGLQFVRVPYDIERAVRLAEAAQMPSLEPYVRELRTAIYRGRQGSAG